MGCDLCGSENDLSASIIEGVTLNVCSRCASYGKIDIQQAEEIQVTRPTTQPNRRFKTKLPETEEVIDENYAIKIKDARERLGLKQADLARKIAEKESLIHKIETSNISPNFAVAKKLEKLLKIKLIKSYENDKVSKVDFESKELTIGDLLKNKQK